MRINAGLWDLNRKGNPVKCKSLGHWVKIFDDKKRLVAKTKVGKALVSTVFLGVDHNFEKGPPILWETMVFGGPHDQECERCGGQRRDALNMHRRMIARVKKGQTK